MAERHLPDKSRAIETERLLTLSHKRFSVRFGGLTIDISDRSQMNIDLDDPYQEIHAVLLSHWHRDHALQERDTLETPLETTTYMNKRTEILLGHVAADDGRIKNRVYVEPYIPFSIEDYAVTPLPFSHASVDNLGYFIVHQPTGYTLLFTSDTGEGKTTDQSIKWIKQNLGSDGVDLFVGDPTGFGDPTASFKTLRMHKGRIRKALNEAERSDIDVLFHIKVGGYDTVERAVMENDFKNWQVHATPGVLDALSKLEMLESLEKKLGYQIESYESVDQLRRRENNLIVTDKQYEPVSTRHPFKVIETSTRYQGHRQGHKPLSESFNAYLAPHSSATYLEIKKAANPDAVAHIHKVDRCIRELDEEPVLPRKGDIYVA